MPPGSVAPDFDRGRRIGKYEILTRLSMGGMAELFLAFTAGPGGFRKFVAVKQILPDIKKDESFVKMFLDEARITAAFSHANIGQVFDLGEQDGELYLAMEFISGQNLEQIIKRSKKRDVTIPIGFSARVVRDACLGLHYAHHFTDGTGKSAPVVHRDVSPKNVMVTYTGDVKMIDFGIAKARGRLNRTQVGIVKGTSGYMSPEQVRNEPLDGRTDLFAAAVMLHELLTGQRLFTAGNDAQMMMKIVEGEIPQPRTINPKVSRELNDVVMKGLMRKRENRFGHGKEFAKAIEQACPEMFEEEKSAAEMSALFEDKIATTRALLELANSDDTGGMTKAVEALVVEEPGDGATPKPAKRTTSTSKQKATPMPREGLPRGRSSSKLPRVGDADYEEESTNTEPPGRKTKGTDRYQSKVARDYAMYDRSDAETEQAQESDEPAPRLDTQDIPKARRRPPPKEKSGGGVFGIIFGVLFLGVVGGLVWAGWKGPLKDSGPAVAARTYLDREINGEPPPPPPPPLDQVKPAGAKPQWLVDKEAKDALDRAEAAKQKAIEEAANDPEMQKQLEEINAQLKELDHQEAELRQLKIDARATGAQGAANTSRIEKLEQEIDNLKKSIADKQAKQKTKKRVADGEVEIVRDVRSAKNADVGYLTMFTINPSHAAVFEGGTSLGTTPLSKVPLDEGRHTLRVVDDESHNRLFEVQVKAGQVTELKGLDVSSMALAK